MISHPGGLESFNCGCHQTLPHPSTRSRAENDGGSDDIIDALYREREESGDWID